MNQIMPVGKGVLIAIERAIRPEEFERIKDLWEREFPDVPVFVVGDAQIILRDGQPILFEFTGTGLTPTFVAEFQRWWEGVNYG